LQVRFFVPQNDNILNRYSSPVSRTASGESGQNNAGLCGCRDIASFAEA